MSESGGGESEEAPPKPARAKMSRDEMIVLIKSAATKVQDAAAFHKVISSILDNGFLTERYFCEPCSPVGVHSLTIKEWRSGASAPHHSFRRLVYAYLLKTPELSK